MLKPPDSQRAALEELLREQQDPSSPNYHKWLTPESYAERFGASGGDIEKIAAWLRSDRFSLEYLARGRDFVSFSGTAGQVRTTFRTEIHRYQVGTETHFANSTDLFLPAAIESSVAGILGLHDFHPIPPQRHSIANYNVSDGSHLLLPADFAAIYHLSPLYLDGYMGAGQSIVVVGQSEVDTGEVAAFRDLAGLPPATIQSIYTGALPFPVMNPDLIEADLDLEWAGAVAPLAKLIYVCSDDATYAAYYAIDNNLAPVISESFGLCELDTDQLQREVPVDIALAHHFGIYYFQMESQKANALGITWVGGQSHVWSFARTQSRRGCLPLRAASF